MLSAIKLAERASPVIANFSGICRSHKHTLVGKQHPNVDCISKKSSLHKHPSHFLMQKRASSQDTMPDEEEESDPNQLAIKNLDITLLKPFPEFRNVVTGPVWEKDHYELLWKHFKEEVLAKDQRLSHDQEWEEYVLKFNCSPIEYLSTFEYKERYGDKLVWKGYFRMKKGAIQRQKTRLTCLKNGVVSVGSPCPLCRDERLLMTYNNLPLIAQFFDQQTGKIHSSLRTGLCQEKMKRVENTVAIAKKYGYWHEKVPFVRYNKEEFKLHRHIR